MDFFLSIAFDHIPGMCNVACTSHGLLIPNCVTTEIIAKMSLILSCNA